MLTEEENLFITYWERKRQQKKKWFLQLYFGLPLAVVLVAATGINFFSGWYKRANMMIRTDQSSLFIVLLMAVLLIVAFVVIFSARHRWEMNEQRYKELLAKRKDC